VKANEDVDNLVEVKRDDQHLYNPRQELQHYMMILFQFQAIEVSIELNRNMNYKLFQYNLIEKMSSFSCKFQLCYRFDVHTEHKD